MTAANGMVRDEPIPTDDVGMFLVGKELGRPANIQTVFSTRGGREWTPKWADPNRLLRFPDSIKVFDAMLRTDDQVGSVMEALTLPILDAPWDLESEGVNQEVVNFVRSEIGLPKPGDAPEHRRRHQAGIVFREHLEEALDCLGYGFAPFEQVYETTFPGDPGHPDIPRFRNQPAVHLRKLASRPPATIYRIRLDRDGGLVSLFQYPIEGDTYTSLTTMGDVGVEIPVNRLVMYVTKKKGADWSGVSVLRTAYRPWRIKEDLCRLDAIASERNSLGVPLVEYDPALMNREAALEIARHARAGAESGIALPINSARFSFVGVTGSVPDLGPKIDRYNQAIGRASLAMFLNLGHDNGARALGDTFLGFFTRSVKAIAARTIGDTFTEHVIRDLCELNFGPDEAYPRLVPGEITAEEAMSPEAFQKLVAAKVIIPDDDLEEAVRRRFRLPEADKGSARDSQPPKPEPAPASGPSEPEVDPVTGMPMAPVATPDAPSPAPGAAGRPNPFLPKGSPSLNADADQAPDRVIDPERPVFVPAHTRHRPRPRASLAGYAAFLAAQVGAEEFYDPDQERDDHGRWGAGGGGGSSDEVPVLERDAAGKIVVSKEAQQLGSAVYEKAVEQEPAISRAVAAAVGDNNPEHYSPPGLEGGKLYGYDHRLKDEAGDQLKVERIVEEKSIGREAAANDIKDAVRYTVHYNQETFTPQAQQTIDRLRDEGHEVRVKNTWESESPYKGINCQVTSPGGQRFELQMHSPENQAVKDQMHGLYEAQRELPAGSARYQELGAQMAAMSYIAPVGVGSIG